MPELVDLYVRLSIFDEEKDGLERQEADLRRWAERTGRTVRKVWRDKGVSAYKPNVDRAAFKHAIAAVTSAEVRTLAVWKLDRLSRQGAGQVGLLMDKLKEADTSIEFVGMGLNTAEEGHRLAIIFMSEQARMESNNTASRINNKNQHLIESGLPVLGKRRFGYLPADAKAKRVVNTVAHPEEAAEVRELYSAFLGGASITTLARRMRWRPVRVRETLANPAYVGMLSANGVTYDAAAHVARLVDRSTFDAVQARLQARSEAYRGYNHRGGQVRHYLSGIAVCGVCGGALSFRNSYLCLADLSHPTIKGEILEARVEVALYKALKRPSALESADPTLPTITTLNGRLLQLQAKKADILTGLQHDLSMADILPSLKPVTAEIEALEGQRERLLQQSVQAQVVASIAANLDESNLRQALSFGPLFRELEIEKQRELVRGLLTVTVFNGRTEDRVVIEEAG